MVFTLQNRFGPGRYPSRPAREAKKIMKVDKNVRPVY